MGFFFFFFDNAEFLLTIVDWTKISQRSTETKGSDLRLPGERRSRFSPFLLFLVNTSAGSVPSERQLHTRASPAWETGLRLITTTSTLAICKRFPCECLKAFFFFLDQLRTKEMPVSVLDENKLVTLTASPSVAS